MRAVRFLLLAVGLVALGGCDASLLRDASPGAVPIVYGPATEREVEKASQRYRSLLLSMDAAGVSNMYAPDGVWERASGPLTGRDAIRSALADTGGVTVMSVDLATSYMSYNGPTVVQTGDITQVVKLANGRTATTSARFEATWIKSTTGEWWIRRMATRRNAPKPAGS